MLSAEELNQIIIEIERRQKKSAWKIAAVMPAQYTPEDPYDLQGKVPLINNMQVEWWKLPPDQQTQAIVNAFRATMVSPRLNLKNNAILYQQLMDIPANESDPDVFENAIRDFKQNYDAKGQTTLEQDMTSDSDNDDQMAYNPVMTDKFTPGFWGNIRKLAALGPYADRLRQAAIDDLGQGGDGRLFRQEVLDLAIPGVGPKVASFAWLALAPTTSQLATIDVHMMNHLNQTNESPSNTAEYMALERQLNDEKNQLYGEDTPLSWYQWSVWDKRRSPGFHQDHTPLRVADPTPYDQVHWAPTVRGPRPQRLPEQVPGQMQLARKSNWKVRGTTFERLATSDSYTIQGMLVANSPQGVAEGVCVRPDIQSKEDIMTLIEGMPTHQDDYLEQRQKIPEWALNRGGKVADIKRGPGGVGLTYAPGVIVVAKAIDVNHNWILENPACVGIVASVGGATSHGVVVARQRNIPVIVDAKEAVRINPGDHLRIDSANAIIEVNGGGDNAEIGEAQIADEPLVAWVWSQGHHMSANITPGSGGGESLHYPMMSQMAAEGKFDMNDCALGITYADGKSQIIAGSGEITDEEQLQEWLKTLVPNAYLEQEYATLAS